MKDSFCTLDKKHGKFFLMALLLSKACPKDKILVGEADGLYYFHLETTDLVYACWYGFIAGKKIGYSMGFSFPQTYTQVFP